MATVQTVIGLDQVKGPTAPSDLRAMRFGVKIVGSYATAAKPTFNILTAIQAMHQAVTAVTVTALTLFADSVVAGVELTIPNANIVLSGTGNQTATFPLDTGAVDGATGIEISDGAIPDQTFQLLAVLSITGAL